MAQQLTTHSVKKMTPRYHPLQREIEKENARARVRLSIAVRVLSVVCAFLALLVGLVIFEGYGLVSDIRALEAESLAAEGSGEPGQTVAEMMDGRQRRFISISLVLLLIAIATGLMLSLKYLTSSSENTLDSALAELADLPPESDHDINPEDIASPADLLEIGCSPFAKATQTSPQLETDDPEKTEEAELSEDLFPDDLEMVEEEEAETPLTVSYNRMVEALQKINELEKKHSLELAEANEKLEKEVKIREKAQKEIRRLSRQLINSAEAAQKKLAQDLHDEFGQTLAALHMRVENLWDSIPFEMEAQRVNINELIVLIEELGDKIRSISSDLRPDLLDDLGLIPTLEWYIKEFMAKYHNIWIDFVPAGFKKRLDLEIELVLYRIFQESLNNIVKHANAHRIEVRLTHNYPRVILMVRDDGVGFDAKQRSGGIGLIGVRERAASIGGTIDIRSEKGRGTIVRVEVPVEKIDDEGDEMTEPEVRPISSTERSPGEKSGEISRKKSHEKISTREI